MSEHRTVRITDVAAAAGVSTATVSRVLNGSTRVAPELVERVRDAATATQYVRNPNGRALRRQRSDMWAVIVSDLQNPFFTSLVAAVERIAVRAGNSVMLCNTDENLEREKTYLAAAVAQRMAGVVVSVTSEEQSDLGRLTRAGVPTVVVDRRVQSFDGDSILLDNIHAGRTAVEHLIGLGHQDVLCLGGPSGVSTTEDRLQGALDAFRAADVPYREERLWRTDLRAAAAEQIVTDVLQSGRRPDAIFTLNGPLTTGAFRAIQNCGLRIPDHLSLVGFDDDPWTRMVTPAVTLISQPVEEMGVLAAERILARAIDPEIKPVHLRLPPRLELRGSTTTKR